MERIFGENGALSAHIDNYEPRAGQNDMAKAVAKVLEDTPSDFQDGVNGRILVVEAETGIGKTLAYLIPAIISEKRVVISTATLNLQDQILKKEIPLAERVLNQDISALCVKGRQNYLCLYRWYQYRSSPQLSFLDDPVASEIEKWLDVTVSGDRAELDCLDDKSALWPQISSQSDQCLGSDCPEVSHCFIAALRKRAGSAHILIVNHHLFFSDLALKKGGYGDILPRYEAVVFDEAHHIENVATTFFGRSFSQYQLIDFISDIERHAEVDLQPEKRNAIVAVALGVKQRVESFMQLFPAKRGRFYLNELIEKLGEKIWSEEISLLSNGLERLSDNLGKYGDYGETWKALERRGDELRGDLLEIVEGAENKNNTFVHWYEKKERSVLLSATPIEVADELKQSLYSTVPACIMTSATLSSGGKFSYVVERLGLDENAELLHFDSPFDYKSRSLLYVPENSFPEPSAPGYDDELCKRIHNILNITQGRALLLFTSFRAMEYVAEYLEDILPFPVLVQGRGSRSGLLQKFREQRHSVLLAVASFWEGVDVAGESLSCVIIDKLPFEVPSDPVLQARIQRITENGGKPFFEFQVPRAILSLRQGVGRLMRSASDCGLIAIMDVRLFKKGYGGTFRKSLPPSPVVRTTTEIASFFEKISNQDSLQND